MCLTQRISTCNLSYRQIIQVAGTDPTDTNSVFSTTITMVDGAPVVEWSPKLSAAKEAQRIYTIYGKASLESGEAWHSPTNALDRFFKIGVGMR